MGEYERTGIKDQMEKKMLKNKRNQGIDMRGK